MSPAKYDAIVIGAGANGLSAALALARGGLRTLVLEAAQAVGGRDRAIEFAPGFRAAPLGQDSGFVPSALARAMNWREPAAAGGCLSVALEPGSFLSLPCDPTRAAENLRPHSAADAAAWPGFVQRHRRLAGMLEALYEAPAPDVDASGAELLRLLQLARRFRSLGRADMTEFLRTLPISIWELLEDAFESPALHAAVATAGLEHHPHGPRANGTGFVFLHQLTGATAGAVRGRAAWGAGACAFVCAAEGAARAAKAEIRTAARIERILIERDRVTGVALEGGEVLHAPRVISTADPVVTLLRWLDPVWLDPELMLALRNVRHRGCTAVVMYALDAAPEFPGLGDPHALAGAVSLTPTLAALERAADAAKYGEVPEIPHLELTMPSTRAPDLAARGHVLVARAHFAPYRLKGGEAWSPERTTALADQVSRRIEAHSPGFAARVQHRECWSPADLERRFGYLEGAASGGELALDQILFMRPLAGWSRYSTPIAGLYLGGAGSHPGPGILGGAGWLAGAEALRRGSPGGS